CGPDGRCVKQGNVFVCACKTPNLDGFERLCPGRPLRNITHMTILSGHPAAIFEADRALLAKLKLFLLQVLRVIFRQRHLYGKGRRIPKLYDIEDNMDGETDKISSLLTLSWLKLVKNLTNTITKPPKFDV
ncbi:unnamed protein product, partial [Didymodactylos carnosus]